MFVVFRDERQSSKDSRGVRQAQRHAIGQRAGFHASAFNMSEWSPDLPPPPRPSRQVRARPFPCACGRRHRGRVWEPGEYKLECADGRERSLRVAELPKPLEIAGPWEVRFAPGGGAPDHVTLPKLISWSDHGDAGVKYFSGTATYRKMFSVPAELSRRTGMLVLDLGRVEVIAQVKLNGQDLGILWKEPFRIDVTGRVKPVGRLATPPQGDNELEVKVVNLWINRMIGDRNCARRQRAQPEWHAQAVAPMAPSGQSPARPAATRSPPGSSGPRARRSSPRACSGP